MTLLRSLSYTEHDHSKFSVIMNMIIKSFWLIWGCSNRITIFTKTVLQLEYSYLKYCSNGKPASWPVRKTNYYLFLPAFLGHAQLLLSFLGTLTHALCHNKHQK